MAYLKAAGKAIMNSPKAIRRKLGGQEGPQKHERKCDNLLLRVWLGNSQ